MREDQGCLWKGIGMFVGRWSVYDAYDIIHKKHTTSGNYCLAKRRNNNMLQSAAWGDTGHGTWSATMSSVDDALVT